VNDARAFLTCALAATLLCRAEPAKAAPGAEPWTVASVPVDAVNAETSIWLPEKDGSRKVIRGAIRMILRRDGIDMAPDVFSSSVSGSFELGGSWYFITAVGDIFRAPTFLGRPVDTGASVGRGARAQEAGSSALIVDDSETLWSFDGSATRRLETPGPVSAVWHTTHDAPLVLICGRWHSIDAAGAIKPARPHAEAKDDSEDTMLVMALLERVSKAVAPGAVTSSEAIFKLDHLIATRNGSFVPAAKLLPKGREDCEILQAGSEPMAYCPPAKRDKSSGENDEAGSDDTAAATGTVFRFGAYGAAQKWLSVAASGDVLASAGPSLFFDGGTQQTWVRANQRTTFELKPGGVCKSYEGRDYGLLGLFGSWVLARQACAAPSPTESFEVIDLSAKADLGKALDVPLGKLLPPGTKVLDATLSADQSTLSVLIADAAGRLAVARGDVPTKLTTRPLPPGTKSIAFVDARRGMAIGTHLGQVWATTDGAASWSPLPIPLGGDPAAVPLHYPLTCTVSSCSSGAEVVWADPRALRATGFVQPSFIVPRHVPPDRTYPGPRPRHPSVFATYADSERPSRCPAVSPPPAPKHARGARHD
jgi:hypothetical protein